MKRVLALALTLCMLLSLAACGGNNTANNSSNPSNSSSTTTPDNTTPSTTPTEPPTEPVPEKPSTPITIKVSVAQTGDGFTALTDAAAAFNASQSDYVVDLYYGGSYAEIRTIMMTSTEADRPDIFAASGNDSAAYIADEVKMYVPVQDFIDAEGFDDSNIVANLRTNYMRDGRWQAWPLGNTNVGVYYNTGILEAAGIDYTTLNSWQEVEAACDTLAAAGHTGFYYARALTHIDWLNYTLTAQGVEYYDAGNGREGVPTKALYSEGECNTATLAYFQFLRNILNKGYVADMEMGSTDARVAFCNGDLAIMDGYSSGANSVVSLVNESATPIQWAYDVSPVVEAGKPSKGQSPGGGCLFIASTGDYWRQQGAWEFMKYLLNDDVVVDYAMKTGYTPITASGSQTAIYQDYIENQFPNAADIIEAQMNTEDGIAYAPIPFSSDANSIYKEVAQNLIDDPNYTAEQAVADLTERINEAIELYRITNGLD